jgi:ribosomal protein S18 acetylase RimI-like enzyme
MPHSDSSQDMNLEILLADYADPRHRQDIPLLLDAYANDPMGGGAPLDPAVKASLVGELAKLPHAFSVIAYVDGAPAGLVNCFEGFSTFQGKPLVNIHDVVVLAAFRGRGIAQEMLAEVERIALTRGCCKLTLEVLSNNEAAKTAYRRFGFSDYQLDPEAGTALFWQKKLSAS